MPQGEDTRRLLAQRMLRAPAWSVLTSGGDAHGAQVCSEEDGVRALSAVHAYWTGNSSAPLPTRTSRRSLPKARAWLRTCQQCTEQDCSECQDLHFYCGERSRNSFNIRRQQGRHPQVCTEMSTSAVSLIVQHDWAWIRRSRF